MLNWAGNMARLTTNVRDIKYSEYWRTADRDLIREIYSRNRRKKLRDQFGVAVPFARAILDCTGRRNSGTNRFKGGEL
jgi:hypothetical protein